MKPPDQYLGAEIQINLRFKIQTIQRRHVALGHVFGHVCQTSCRRFRARELEQIIGKALPTRCATPLSLEYRPKIDTTPELDDKRANYYQGPIGIMRWMCKLGRVEILMLAAMQSRYLAVLREGHLDQVFHLFVYLKRLASILTSTRLCLSFEGSPMTSDRNLTCLWWHPSLQNT